MAVDVGRIGVWAFSTQWGEHERLSAQALAAVREAEQLGYAAVWIGRAHGELRLAESILDATQRIAVGTSIVNIWMYSPETVARAYHRVSNRHPARLLLGLGVGHAPSVEATTGQRYERPVAKMQGYLDELDRADPPVLADRRALAALGPRMLALSAQRAVGALPYLTTPEHTRKARETIGPDALLAVEQKVVLDSDPAAARAIARAGVRRYLRLPNYTNNLKRLGFTEEDVAGEGSDRLIDAVTAWGSTSAVAQRVQEHLDAGADHVGIQVLTEGAVAAEDLPVAEWRELAPALVL